MFQQNQINITSFWEYDLTDYNSACFSEVQRHFLPQVSEKFQAHTSVSPLTTNPDWTWSKATKKWPLEFFTSQGEVFNRKQVEVKPSGFDTYTLNRAYFKWWLHDSEIQQNLPVFPSRERESNDKPGWNWRKETSFAILLEVFPQSHPEGAPVTCVFELCHSILKHFYEALQKALVVYPVSDDMELGKWHLPGGSPNFSGLLANHIYFIVAHMIIAII